MQKLVNVDRVQAVIGGFCSSESLAATVVAEENKVFLLSTGSSSPDLTGVSDYFARTYPSDATQGTVLAEIAFEKQKWTNVVAIQEQQDYALGLYNAFQEKFTELGGTVTKEEYVSNETDFRTSLTKLRAENADALFIDGQTPATMGRVLKQLQDLDWTPKILMNDVLAGSPETITQYAVLLEGAIGAEFIVDENNQKYAAFVENYSNTYNEEVQFTSYAQTEYDGVYILADALRDVGNDGEKLSQWFKDVKNWKGASGTINFKNGDRAGGHTPKVVRNGKVEILTD